MYGNFCFEIDADAACFNTSIYANFCFLLASADPLKAGYYMCEYKTMNQKKIRIIKKLLKTRQLIALCQEAKF